MPFPVQPILYLYTSHLLDISIQRTYHFHIPNHNLDTQSSLVSGLFHLLVAQARNLIFLFTHPTSTPISKTSHLYFQNKSQFYYLPFSIVATLILGIVIPFLYKPQQPSNWPPYFHPCLLHLVSRQQLAKLLKPPVTALPHLAFSALHYCWYKIQDHFQGLQELSPHFHSNPGPLPIPLDFPPASRPLHMLFLLSELPFVQLLIHGSSTSPDYVFLVSLDPH